MPVSKAGIQSQCSTQEEAAFLSSWFDMQWQSLKVDGNAKLELIKDLEALAGNRNSGFRHRGLGRPEAHAFSALILGVRRGGFQPCEAMALQVQGLTALETTLANEIKCAVSEADGR